MSNEEQIAYWNGDSGKKWAELDAQMARLLGPVAEMLMDHAGVDSARCALDVGCGGGSDSFVLAQRLGDGARVLAVDVSEPMLAVAKAQRDQLGLDQVEFLEADAATHDFKEQRFDLLFSRFGVMFFDDPYGAFAHLRGAMAPEGRLAFACWQPLADNPWTAVPLKAALTILPPAPPPPPRSPGPFAFEEPAYVEDILHKSGWSNVSVQPRQVEMRWPDGGGFETTARELVKMSPVGRLLAEVDYETRQKVYSASETVLREYYEEGEGLILEGAVWLVTADNGKS